LTATTPSLAAEPDYSNVPLERLIDDLTLVDSEGPGFHGTAEVDGFIGADSVLQFGGGVVGSPAPVVLPQMRELVRRGALALPALIRHLNDRRSTKLSVGGDSSNSQVGLGFFGGQYFDNEYASKGADNDPVPSGLHLGKGFEGSYVIKVGDVCYALIGQIVNRHLEPVRYQPTAILIINSPIQSPDLIARVRRDWAGVRAEGLKLSLLHDLRIGADASSLIRLRTYFPETYTNLIGLDRKKRDAFEYDEQFEKKLALAQKTSAVQDVPLDRDLDSCTSLSSCLSAIDRNIHDPWVDFGQGEEEVTTSLRRFGDAAKKELLDRADAPDTEWRMISHAVLRRWPSLTADDLPPLLDGFKMKNGLFAAYPIVKIGSPEAMQVLIAHFKVWRENDVVADALADAGPTALPYLLPLLTDEKTRVVTTNVIRDMGAKAIPAVDELTATAIDRRHRRANRIAALRALEAIGYNAAAAREVLVPMLNDGDEQIRAQARITLDTIAENYSEYLPLVADYVRKKHGWSDDMFQIGFNRREGTQLAFWVVRHDQQGSAQTPGGPGSIEVRVDPTKRQVISEVRFQSR
jgi:hypothetical protein